MEVCSHHIATAAWLMILNQQDSWGMMGWIITCALSHKQCNYVLHLEDRISPSAETHSVLLISMRKWSLIYSYEQFRSVFRSVYQDSRPLKVGLILTIFFVISDFRVLGIGKIREGTNYSPFSVQFFSIHRARTRWILLISAKLWVFTPKTCRIVNRGKRNGHIYIISTFIYGAQKVAWCVLSFAVLTTKDPDWQHHLERGLTAATSRWVYTSGKPNNCKTS